MTVSATELRLALAARAENLALVRQALAGLADSAGISDPQLGDLKQIATEACMNAAVHAYPDGNAGPMEVVAQVIGEFIEVRVRDWGTGFHPRPMASERASLRIGLPLIASLAESVTLASPADGAGGTELVARLRTISNGDRPDPTTSPSSPRQEAEAEMEVTAGASAKPVIARVIAVAATRAGLSLDRMSDGILLGDAIAGHAAEDFSDRRVGIDIEEWGPRLSVRVGPFVAGGAERMLQRMELPDLGVSLRKLANRVEVQERDEGEFLVIEIAP